MIFFLWRHHYICPAFLEVGSWQIPQKEDASVKYLSLKELFENLMKTGEHWACQLPITPVFVSLKGEDIRLVYMYTNLWISLLLVYIYVVFLERIVSKLGNVLYRKPQERVSYCVVCMMLKWSFSLFEVGLSIVHTLDCSQLAPNLD